MPYQYSFDRTTLGNAWWYKKTYAFYQKGLKTLRTLLDAWKEKAGTDNHPYEREVKDLTTMIEWGDDRLKQIDDSGEIHISGISRGSLRYLKAAATLQVIEKEKQIAAREQEGFPGGVLDAMRRDLQEIKRKEDLLKVEPADCLWEVFPKPIAPPPSPSAAAPSPEPIHRVKHKGRTRRKWDFFISHAAEEADFARSLAFKLEECRFQVWYDAFVLTAGDSLLEKIDEGLARSRYGVVILSHAFFKKSWTKKELDGLATLEGKKKRQKVILPVWHDLTVEEVRKYSPSLAGRIGVPTKDGLDFVVGELLRAVKIPKE